MLATLGDFQATIHEAGPGRTGRRQAPGGHFWARNLNVWGWSHWGESETLMTTCVSQTGDDADVPRRLLWPTAMWKGNHL